MSDEEYAKSREAIKAYHKAISPPWEALGYIPVNYRTYRSLTTERYPGFSPAVAVACFAGIF